MLNYSTSLLQYLHLNTSSDYETVMIQFFITKHLITKHLITKHLITKHLTHNFNKLSDRYFTKLFTKLFIRPSFTTILSQQLYSNMENIFHHKLQRIIFDKRFILLFFKYLHHNFIHKLFITTSFTNSSSQLHSQTLHKYSDELYISSQTFTNSLSRILNYRFTSSQHIE